MSQHSPYIRVRDGKMKLTMPELIGRASYRVALSILEDLGGGDPVTGALWLRDKMGGEVSIYEPSGVEMT